jgi:hypothetical protein
MSKIEEWLSDVNHRLNLISLVVYLIVLMVCHNTYRISY